MYFLNKNKKRDTQHLATATTTTALSAGGVGGDRGDVLDAADLETRAGEGAKGGLGAGARGLGASATSGTDLEVKGVDADLLAADSDVLGGKHGGVRGGLVGVGLDLHTTGDTGDSLTAGQIGDVDESIVERGENASNAEDKVALAVLQTNSVNHSDDLVSELRWV